jgi:hypothetical protein
LVLLGGAYTRSHGHYVLNPLETRICPGIHFARASLFIAIASILATFNISAAKDCNGNEIIPVVEGENNAI